MRKRITIHTNIIELQFFWNKKAVVSQSVLLIVLFFMYKIGFTRAIKNFCLLGLMIDIGFCLIILLPGFYVNIEEVSPGTETQRDAGQAATNKVETADINHNSTNENNVVVESSATIDNKVGGTVQAPTQPQPQLKPEPVQHSEPPAGFDMFTDNQTTEEKAEEQAGAVDNVDMDSIYAMFTDF